MYKIITILLFFISILPAQTMIVEELGLYDTYSLSVPKLENTKINENGSQVIEIDKNKGYYIDGRNQMMPHERILPPNPDKIPEKSNPTKKVEPFDSYYERNIVGERRHPYMTPIVPNYNRFYSERRERPYTKQEYVDVWCGGEQNVNGADCETKSYSIYFYAVRNWPVAFTMLPFKARKANKKVAFFFWIDDLGLDAVNTHNAKEWAKMFNVPVFFGTIDSFIPIDWII